MYQKYVPEIRNTSYRWLYPLDPKDSLSHEEENDQRRTRVEPSKPQKPEQESHLPEIQGSISGNSMKGIRQKGKDGAGLWGQLAKPCRDNGSKHHGFGIPELSFF